MQVRRQFLASLPLRHLAQTLDRLTAKIRELAAPDAELGDTHRQLIHQDQLQAMADAPDARGPLPDDITNDLITRGMNALEHPDL